MKCVVNLLGHVTDDPHLIEAGGKTWAVFHVLTTEERRDPVTGERTPSRGMIHRVVVRQSGTAKAIGRRLQRGQLVDVTGTLAPSDDGPGAAFEIQVRAGSHTVIFVNDAPPRTVPRI